MEWISAGLSWKTRFAEGQGALAFVFLSDGLGVAGCSSPGIAEWRSSSPAPRTAAERGDPAADDRRVEELRSRLELAASVTAAPWLGNPGPPPYYWQ